MQHGCEIDDNDAIYKDVVIIGEYEIYNQNSDSYRNEDALMIYLLGKIQNQ